jgi:hypothetical protein
VTGAARTGEGKRMSDTQLRLDEPLRLHPLTYLEEGDDVTVGRADIDSYGVFPRDGADLVRRLEQGDSPAEAARWYEQQYGETVDVAEFLEVLEDLDLVVRDGQAVAPVQAVRWRRLGVALFSPPAWVAYAAIVVAALVAMVRNHSLVPRYQHLFFTRSSLTLLTLGIVLGQVPWMLLHEAFHALAGRRLGLNSKLSIGRRFYYLVFVTSLDGLVAVPRSKRYLPMLAGMMLDTLVAASLTLAAAALASTTGVGALFYKLLLSMAFGVVLRLAWQFYFFLRTDLFFLATTVLGCNDLQGASRQYLSNRARILLGRRSRVEPMDAWTARDGAVARWYSWLMVAGYGLLTFMVATVMVPTAVRIVEIVVHKLRDQRTVLGAADLVVFLVLNFSEVAIAAFLAARSYSRNRRLRDQRTSAPPLEDLRSGALNTPAA